MMIIDEKNEICYKCKNIKIYRKDCKVCSGTGMIKTTKLINGFDEGNLIIDGETLDEVQKKDKRVI